MDEEKTFEDTNRMTAAVSAGSGRFSTPNASDSENRGTGLGRRAMLFGGVGLPLALSSIGNAATPSRSLRLCRLQLPDLPDPRPTALKRLGLALERRTSLVADAEPVSLRPTDPSLFSNPVVFLTGDRGFAPLPDADVVRLRRFITFGGFLFVDSAEGRAGGGFDASVRRLLARLLPGDLPKAVPESHVLWKSFYLLKSGVGRVEAAPYVEAVEREKRIGVLYTQNDVCGAMARDGYGRWEHEVIPGGEGQRELAFRFAVNAVMYALCLDYKEEQAHIDFILRTRRARP